MLEINENMEIWDPIPAWHVGNKWYEQYDHGKVSTYILIKNLNYVFYKHQKLENMRNFCKIF